MSAEVITTALTGVVTNLTGTVEAAAPIVLGAMGVIAGVNIGLKLFKKFANKAA